MLSKKRVIIAALIFALGCVLFVYGIGFDSATVLAEEEDQPGKISPIQLMEWSVNKDITVGGLTRNASGALKRTYTGQAPSLCPT